jgi:hypothetical protein
VLALAAAWAVKTGEARKRGKSNRASRTTAERKKVRSDSDTRIIQEVLFEIKRYARGNIFEILRC